MLTDAGPLVALLDADDACHHACVEIAEKLRRPLVTTWPALTEALHLLQRTPRADLGLMDLVARGDVVLAPMDRNDIPRIRELMAKYRDLPMDFADASLVRIAERDGLHKIFTTDRHFEIYRPRVRGREQGRFAIVP